MKTIAERISAKLNLPLRDRHRSPTMPYFILQELSGGESTEEDHRSFLTSPAETFALNAPMYVEVPHNVDYFRALYGFFLRNANDIMVVNRAFSVIELSMMNYLPRAELKPPPARDPLGLRGAPDGSSWETMSPDYFKVIDPLHVYRDHLMRYSTYGSRLESSSYDTPYSSLQSIEARVGELITLLSKVPSSVPLHFLGDGVGVGSMAALALKRKYTSSEPNAIGELGVRFGIITTRDTAAQHLARKLPGLYVWSNLSRFVEVESLAKLCDSVIYDVSCPMIPGFRFLDPGHTIATNTSYFEDVSKIVAHEPTLPDISTIAEASLVVKINDTPLREAVARAGKLSDTGKEVVRHALDVVRDDQYIMSERKVASAPSVNYLSTQYTDGFAFRSGRDAVRYTATSASLVEGQDHRLRTTTLDRAYDIGLRSRADVIVPFYPGRLRGAYSNGKFVNVMVLSYERMGVRRYRVCLAVVASPMPTGPPSCMYRVIEKFHDQRARTNRYARRKRARRIVRPMGEGRIILV